MPGLTRHLLKVAVARVVRGSDVDAQRMLQRMERDGVTALDADARTRQYNQNITYCAKANETEAAERWMQKMLDDPDVVPDCMSFNALIDSYAQVGDVSEAQRCLAQMKALGLQPDQVSMSALINACAQAKDVAGARQALEKMKALGLQPNQISMSALIKAQVGVRSVDMRAVLATLEEMRSSGLSPNSHTYFQLLLACKKTRDCTQAYQWFDELLTAKIEPIELLCSVLRDTAGLRNFEDYKTSRAQLFAEANRAAAKGGSKGGGKGRDRKGKGGYSKGANRTRVHSGEQSGKGKGKGVCNRWSSGQHCRYGADCRYLHE